MSLNYFNTFSRSTLNTLLFFLAIGWSAYLIMVYRNGPAIADAIVLSAIGLFVLAVWYVTVVKYVNTNGASAGASPWYMQVLLVPVLTVVVRGLARLGYVGRVLTVAQVGFGHMCCWQPMWLNLSLNMPDTS